MKGNILWRIRDACHPHNQMMDLHLRQVFFTPDGWPVVSPERYTGSASRKFSAADMAGEWESYTRAGTCV